MWSSSSIPTEAAWAVLKRDDMDSLPPELESQMQSFYEQIPDEQREKIEQLGQAVETMDPETKHKIKTMLLQTVMHNADKMPEILQDADPSGLFGLQETEPGTFKVDSGPVKKAFFVPLVIAAVFAADGINQSQGAKASIVGNGLLHTGAKLGLNDPPKTSAFEYDDAAVFQDPFLGVELGRAENPSWWQRAGAGVLGAAQGLSFGTVTAKPVRAAISSKRSTMAAGKAGKVGDKISAIPEGRKGLRGMTDSQKRKYLTDKQTRLQAKSKKLADRAAKPASQRLGTARRFGQATLGDPRAKPALGALFAGALQSGNTPNISGSASATPSGGGAGSGIGGMTNTPNTRQGDKQIWQKQGDQGHLEQQRTAAGSGGYGTNKGDNMNIGEQILKEVDMRIHKAHCVTQKADDCPKCKGKKKCKCGDDTKKGSKKPAHGMIIVLGAQGTGPGPSKDGKRTKK